MDHTDQANAPEATTPLLGSAEPLSREETLARLRELQAWGVDLSLIRANLQRTPTERLLQNESLGRLIGEMQTALREGRVKPSEGRIRRIPSPPAARSEPPVQ